MLLATTTPIYNTNILQGAERGLVFYQKNKTIRIMKTDIDLNIHTNF